MNLTEIKVEGFNLDEDENFRSLYEIYRDILVDDDWWHFFREGDYSLIRCEDDMVGKVTKYLEDNLGIMPGQIEITEPWVDNIKATRTYQTEFMYMFHAFSVLAMKLLADEQGRSQEEATFSTISVFDRVVHCCLNNIRSDRTVEGFGAFIPLKRESHIFNMWESAMIMHNALMRMYTLGNYSGKREMQGIIEKLMKPEEESDG